MRKRPIAHNEEAHFAPAGACTGCVADWIEGGDVIAAMVEGPEAFQRFDAIRALAREQVRDDQAQETLFSLARGDGGAHGPNIVQLDEDTPILAPAWSPDADALAEGFRPFLDQLTQTQQDTIRRLIWLRESEREAARDLQLERNTVKQNKRRAIIQLRKALTDRYIVILPEAERRGRWDRGVIYRANTQS